MVDYSFRVFGIFCVNSTTVGINLNSKRIENYKYMLRQHHIMQQKQLSDEEWSVAREIARMLRFFIELGNYGYVDRLSNTYNIEIVERTIYEALRESKASMSYIRTNDEGKKVYVDSKGKVYNITPYIPPSNIIQKFLDSAAKDLRICRIASALAFTYITR